MSLTDEWNKDSLPVQGADVFCKRTGKVSHQWLSACEEERALTGELMDKVCDLSNLIAALKQVVKNGGSAGVDGMSVQELRHWFSGNHQRLISQLKEGSYEPMAVRGHEIPKPGGGVRQLGIPTVQDRLVQQAIAQQLSKRYDPVFSQYSYGFRKGRNAHQALRQAGQYVKEGFNYVVDLDLEKFFDKVNHDRLMWLLGRRLSDKRILKLIGRFLRSGMLIAGLESQRTSGTPQGSPLSPLLSNIVLDELDKELERRGHRFVRYADDMILFAGSSIAAERVYSTITSFIEGRLRLKINKDKSRICRPYQLNFLGHSIMWDGKLGLSKTSEQRFKAKVKQVTRRNRGISIGQMITELNRALRGWLNYFRNAKMLSKLRKLSSWIHRRIRCFRLKQCKRAVGITRFLVSLGLPEWRSILLAASHKGWYRKAGSPQAHEGMNKDWFQKIGLFNLVEYYSLHFKETARYESTPGGVRGQ